MANLLARDHGPLAPVTNPVYHYTDADGLLGALSARRLWASQATSLNDRAEIRQGWDLIVDSLQELRRAHPEDMDLEMLLRWAREPLNKVRHICVLCASLRPDDANQWRLYGGESRGYAIELDPEVPLTAVVDEGEPPDLEQTPGHIVIDFNVLSMSGWLRAIYEPDELRQAVEDLWRAVTEATAPPPEPNLSRDEYEAEQAEWWNGIQAVAFEELATLAHLVKTEGFSGEHEARMVVTHLQGSAYLKYRPTVNGVVGYRELARLPEDHRVHRPYFTVGRSDPLPQLPVRSVRLGPLAPEGHEETVQDYLETVDLKDIRVARSDVPLR